MVATESPSIIPGTTVNGRFALIRPLGKGSMGSVWLARHLSLDIDVALKFIDTALAAQPNYVERFKREARAAAQIRSSHVVHVLDYGTDGDERPFMALEYLDGVTVGSFLKDNGVLGPTTTARIVAHAAKGLGKAHALGIVHRDIKPENLFLCGDGDDDGFIAKVLDFGVAKAGFNQAGTGTMAGQLIGSPAYMSPEQARGYRSVDYRTDLYSLALVAYQCLTGKNPFLGEGLSALLLNICSNDAPPPSSIIPALPLELDAWFERALAKKPQDRFDSARELSFTFGQALGQDAQSGIGVISSYGEPRSFDGASSSAAAFGGSSARGPVPSSSSNRQTKPSASASGAMVSEDETRVTTPRLSQSASRSMSSSGAGSTASSVNVFDALESLSIVPHVDAVALLDAEDRRLQSRGQALSPELCRAVASRVRSVVETMESLDGAEMPTHLLLRFERGALYVRWLGPFTLVVKGSEKLRPLLLTVGSNKLVGRLEKLIEQRGELAVEALRGNGEADTHKAGQSGAAGLAATGRAAAGPPSASSAIAPEAPPRRGPPPPPRRRRGAQTSPATPAAMPPLPKRSEQPSSSDQPSSSSRHDAPAPSRVHESTAGGRGEGSTLSGSRTSRKRVLVHRGKVVGDKPAKEEKPKKRVRLYRGKVIDD